MNLSKFTKNDDGVFEGKIQGLGLGSVYVQSQIATSKKDTIYYRLVATDANGDKYEVGSMWPREKDGLKYLSVSLDSPFFAQPINAALFPDKDEPNAYRLIWQREPIAKTEATNATAIEGVLATLGTTDLRNGEPKNEIKALKPSQKSGFLKTQPKL